MSSCNVRSFRLQKEWQAQLGRLETGCWCQRGCTPLFSCLAYYKTGTVRIFWLIREITGRFVANLKYTDIDYHIYNGGAKGMLRLSPDPIQNVVEIDSFQTRASPYWRSTYRYSPIMALLAMPNSIIGHLFGKILFSLFNVLTGWIMHKILVYRQVEETTAKILLSMWIYNPMTIQIATRGNADSLMTLLVSALVYFVLRRRPILAGLCLGLAVHIKIYPALYAFPLLMVWNNTCTLENFRLDLVGHIHPIIINTEPGTESILWKKETIQAACKLCVQILIAPWRFAYRFLTRRLNVDQWIFGLSALMIFALLTGGFYLKYGWTFLYETYLYHGIRHDHRHNFSPFSAWATIVTPRRDPTEDIIYQYGALSQFKLVQKIAQLPLTMLLGFTFIHTAPELSLFLQTAWFVIFNSVSTAQYFIWYLALLPLALATSPRIQKGQNLKGLWTGLGAIFTLWLAADLHWVYWSHRFEFEGESEAFLGMFVATWAFAGASILLMSFVMKWSREDSDHIKKE